MFLAALFSVSSLQLISCGARTREQLDDSADDLIYCTLRTCLLHRRLAASHVSLHKYAFNFACYIDTLINLTADRHYH
jgi:hypothetical protein